MKEIIVLKRKLFSLLIQKPVEDLEDCDPYLLVLLAEDDAIQTALGNEGIKWVTDKLKTRKECENDE